jgi:hypothetical protein
VYSCVFFQELVVTLLYLSCFTDFFCFLLLSSAFRATFLGFFPPCCLHHFRIRLRKKGDAQSSLQQTDEISMATTQQSIAE